MLDFFGSNLDETENNSHLNRVNYVNGSGSRTKNYSSGIRRAVSGLNFGSYGQSYRPSGNNRSTVAVKRNRSVSADNPLSPLYLFLYYLLSIFWLEMDIRFAFSTQTFSSVLFLILFFSVPLAAVLFMISYAMPKKVNFWVTFLLSAVFIVIFGSQIVYHQIFEVYYTMYQATTTGEALQFVDTIFSSILKSLGYIALALVPLVVLCVWGRKYFFTDTERRPVVLAMALLVGILCQLSSISLLKSYGEEYGSPYNLYYKTMNFDVSVEKLGMFTTLRIDMQRLVFGFEEETSFISDPTGGGGTGKSGDGEEQGEIVYGDNVMDIDFAQLAENAKNKTIKSMHEYFATVTPTAQNEKTGMFKDCNVIWITAESFSPYLISEELTPTLYKMKTEGFNFTNFYSPLWSGSTLAGEYVLCTSLLPKNQDGIRSFKASTDNNMYFCMGNQMRRLGYTTYAFHNNTYSYYGRDKTHPNMGYTYLGVGNGLKLEHPKYWPQSDLELMNASTPYYIDEEHFAVYYMTVSGHCNYSFTGNRMASLNKEYVKSLNLGYSDTVTAYLSCNYELEKAMTELLRILNEKGIAENTVIVMAPDHYPYELSHAQLEELAGHTISEPFETYRSQLIIYKQGMTPETVDTLCSSLDVLPTLSNLLGIEYDSRLLAGTDIFSEHESVVICPNRNWITDVATYISTSKKVTNLTDEELPEDYVSRINTYVNNKFTASQQILDNDYYRVLFGD